MSPNRYLALLRGINVGGKNKLPMNDLKAMMEDLGCSNVETYVQSGNAVFTATAAVAKKLPVALSAQLNDKLGIQVPVVLRRGKDFCAALAKHPLAKRDSEDKQLHVAFLASRPTAAQTRALDPDRSPSDSFLVVGREVFMLCPNGVARSKLTNAWFDKELKTVSTARNWRTVGKLKEMLTAD